MNNKKAFSSGDEFSVYARLPRVGKATCVKNTCATYKKRERERED